MKTIVDAIYAAVKRGLTVAFRRAYEVKENLHLQVWSPTTAEVPQPLVNVHREFTDAEFRAANGAEVTQAIEGACTTLDELGNQAT